MRTYLRDSTLDSVFQGGTIKDEHNPRKSGVRGRTLALFKGAVFELVRAISRFLIADRSSQLDLHLFWRLDPQ